MIWAYLLTSLAGLELANAIRSYWGGRRFVKMFEEAAQSRRSNTSEAATSYTPPATLIVPFRGREPGLEANMKAFLELDYPDLRLIFVGDDEQDPALKLALSLKPLYADRDLQIISAGKTHQCSQKVHNLLVAVEKARSSDQVLAFADSDIQPNNDWLRDLIAPLADKKVGISTGAPWYMPSPQNFASLLRSVWNAGTVSLMKRKGSPFAFGCAMAIRRTHFDACNVARYWRHALSDDYAMSEAIKAHGLKIAFQPKCISFSYGPWKIKPLFDWVFRLLCITRVNKPNLWIAALVAQTITVSTLWGGLLVGFLGFLNTGENIYATLLSFSLGIFAFGALKARLRLNAIAKLYPAERARLSVTSYQWLWPIAALLSLACLVRTLFSREIEWRGYRYRMESPHHTKILRIPEGTASPYIDANTGLRSPEML